MKESAYRQCRLARDNLTETAWIPTRFAVVGKVVRVRREGRWEEGWRVLWAGKTELTEQETERRSRDWMRSRAATDV